MGQNSTFRKYVFLKSKKKKERNILVNILLHKTPAGLYIVHFSILSKGIKKTKKKKNPIWFHFFIATKMYKVLVIINVKMLEKAYLELLTVQWIETLAWSVPSMFVWNSRENSLICFCHQLFFNNGNKKKKEEITEQKEIYGTQKRCRGEKKDFNLPKSTERKRKKKSTCKLKENSN